jgi:hypothetical protein
MEEYQRDLKLGGDDLDKFGRPNTNQWTYKGENVYTAKSTKNLIATYATKVNHKTIYSLLDDRDALSATLTAVRNGKGNVVIAPAKASTLLTKNSTSNFLGDDGTQIEVYYDSTAKEITVVAYDYFLVKAAADYNENKKSVKVTPYGALVVVGMASADLELSSKDFSVTDVKEKDYLIVTVADKVIKSVAPAAKVTGTVSSYTKDTNITVDGTQYSKSGVFGDDTGLLTAFDSLKTGSDLTLVLDPNSRVVTTTDEVSKDQYVYIYKFANNDKLEDEYKAIAYFTDGTRQIITLTSDAYKVASAAAVANGMQGEWFNYSVKKNGNYDLATFAGVKQAAATPINVTSKAINYAFGYANANNDTVYVVKKADKDTATVYTGYKNAPGATGATVAAVEKSSVAKFVFIEATTVKGANSGDYLVIYGANPIAAFKENVSGDNDTYWSYANTFLNGTQQTTEFDNATKLYRATAAMFTGLSYDADGRVSGFEEELTAATATNAAAGFAKVEGVVAAGVSYKAGVLNLNAVDSYAVDANAVAYVIDGTNVDSVAFTSIKANLDDTAVNYKVFIVFTDTTDDHIIKAVYFVK